GRGRGRQPDGDDHQQQWVDVFNSGYSGWESELVSTSNLSIAGTLSESGHPTMRKLMGQSGFTLIEGMIAAIVLAVGLLAVAGMQGISLGRNVDANELGRVTNLAADMVERIQFNRRNATAYNNIDTLNAATQPPTTQPMAR